MLHRQNDWTNAKNLSHNILYVSVTVSYHDLLHPEVLSQTPTSEPAILHLSSVIELRAYKQTEMLVFKA